MPFKKYNLFCKLLQQRKSPHYKKDNGNKKEFKRPLCYIFATINHISI